MRDIRKIKEFEPLRTKGQELSGMFNVYRIEDYNNSIAIPYNRRDYYKITLVSRGEGILSYGEKTVHIKDSALIFTNPMIPYSYESLAEKEQGFFCLFTEEFITSYLRTDSLSDSPLFKVHGNHILLPDPASAAFLGGIFEHMLQEMQSSYINKFDLLRSYVQIIIHQSLKIERPRSYYQAGTSSVRLSDLFLELLERQFPISSPAHTMQVKNAHEFATQLGVHTNHLNRALRETTGKTTTEHLAERILKEAKSLLLHSSWDISEIGYCLGFNHPSNFYLFFKRNTGQTAKQFRRRELPIHS